MGFAFFRYWLPCEFVVIQGQNCWQLDSNMEQGPLVRIQDVPDILRNWSLNDLASRRVL